jgi:hypothetical protein
MSQVQIRPISEENVEGFCSCLDAVARERKYLALLKAPSMGDTRKWLVEAMSQAEIRLVAIDGSQIVGWCDIEAHTREGFGHSGKLAVCRREIFFSNENSVKLRAIISERQSS